MPCRSFSASNAKTVCSHASRPLSVRAVTPCDLFVLDKADFDRALEQYPHFAGVDHDLGYLSDHGAE